MGDAVDPDVGDRHSLHFAFEQVDLVVGRPLAPGHRRLGEEHGTHPEQGCDNPQARTEEDDEHRRGDDGPHDGWSAEECQHRETDGSRHGADDV